MTWSLVSMLKGSDDSLWLRRTIVVAHPMAYADLPDTQIQDDLTTSLHASSTANAESILLNMH